jgi:hypothetical protein
MAGFLHEYFCVAERQSGLSGCCSEVKSGF